MQPDPPPFAALAREQQADLLLAAVTEALPALGLRGTPVLLGQDFNVTYRVDDPVHGPVAVRCNLDSPRTPDEVAAEVAWVRDLAGDGAPVAQPVGDGRVATVAIPGLRDDAPVVAYHWIHGEDLGEVLGDRDRTTAGLAGLRDLGATMGVLHDHARTFTLPAGTSRPVYEDWLLGEEWLLDGVEASQEAWATPDVLEVHAAARSAVDERLDDLFSATGAALLLHGDLHPWNARVGDTQRTVVFDFDDCGFGPPVLDLSISLFYLRADPAHEHAFLSGLAASGPSGAALAGLVGTPALEALVAGRQLLMMSSLVGSPSGGPPDFDVGAYARGSRDRLAHWLDTGRLVLRPPT